MSELESTGECDGLLRMEAMGKATLLTSRKTYADLAEQCRSAGLRRVLLDARGLEGRLSVFEVYEMASHVGELFRSASLRMAVVTSPNGLDRDFSETACRNRGVDVMFSYDIRLAEAWLEETS